MMEDYKLSMEEIGKFYYDSGLVKIRDPLVGAG